MDSEVTEKCPVGIMVETGETSESSDVDLADRIVNPSYENRVSVPPVSYLKPALSSRKNSAVSTSSHKHITFNVKEKPRWKKWIGIFFAGISAVFFSLVILTIKSVPSLHPITQCIWRYGVCTVLNVLIVVGISGYRQSRSEEDGSGSGIFAHVTQDYGVSTRQAWTTFGKIVVIGAIGGAGTLLESTALNHMSPTDATAVTFVSFVFVLLFTCFCIRKKCSAIPALMALCIMVGVGVISRPPFLTGEAKFNSTLVVGIRIKLLDGLSTAIYVLCIRSIRHLHFALLSLVVGAVGLILSIASSISLGLYESPTDGKEIGLLIGLGILHFLASFGIILALRLENVGPVTWLQTMSVPLVLLWQFLILDDVPDIWTIVGSLLICFGVAVVTIRTLTEDHKKFPKDSPTKPCESVYPKTPMTNRVSAISI